MTPRAPQIWSEAVASADYAYRIISLETHGFLAVSALRD